MKDEQDLVTDLSSGAIFSDLEWLLTLDFRFQWCTIIQQCISLKGYKIDTQLQWNITQSVRQYDFQCSRVTPNLDFKFTIFFKNGTSQSYTNINDRLDCAERVQTSANVV